MQLIIATLILAIAAAYAAWRTYKVLTHKESPCTNCQGCDLKGTISQKEQCPEKKNN